MDALLVGAASGMKARIESLEIVANNLANENSAGYKMDREAYRLYQAAEAAEGTDPDALPYPPVVPVIERHWTDYTQGVLSETNNPAHIAIQGEGFLTAAGPSGTLLTRNGALRLSASGGLETADGFAVLDDRGQPVRLLGDQPFVISELGEIRQQGTVVARLGVVSFPDRSSLQKREGTYFAAPAEASAQPFTGRLLQGRLEKSNGAPAESAVRIVTILREFEMLQRAILIGGEMGKKSDEVARVNP